jgi:hypothetical protein
MMPCIANKNNETQSKTMDRNHEENPASTESAPHSWSTRLLSGGCLLAALGFGALMLSHYNVIGDAGKVLADPRLHSHTLFILSLVALEGLLAGWWGWLVVRTRIEKAISGKEKLLLLILLVLWLVDRLAASTTTGPLALPLVWPDFTVLGIALAGWGSLWIPKKG